MSRLIPSPSPPHAPRPQSISQPQAAQIQSAMILAAGYGKRMRPLTAKCPKPLVRVAGKPLIDYSLDKIEAANIGNVVVNSHYLADILEAHLVRQHRTCRIKISREHEQILDTGGGLVHALPMLDGDPILVANSDSIWSDGPQMMIKELAHRWDSVAMDALLLLIPVARANGHRGPGDFHMDSYGIVKRRRNGWVAPFVYTGMQLVARRLLRDVPPGAFSMNLLWDRALVEKRLYGLSHRGLWFDVGTVAAVAATEAALCAM